MSAKVKVANSSEKAKIIFNCVFGPWILISLAFNCWQGVSLLFSKFLKNMIYQNSIYCPLVELSVFVFENGSFSVLAFWREWLDFPDGAPPTHPPTLPNWFLPETHSLYPQCTQYVKLLKLLPYFQHISSITIYDTVINGTF